MSKDEKKKSLSELYGKHYFDHYAYAPYERENIIPFFEKIADKITSEINPKTVLDVGCAKGYLVELLWDRGIKTYGIDISEYAISQVRSDIKNFCKVQSITDPIEEKYDLIVCIEVVEHLLPEYADIAISNICRAADDILFSSTPEDLREPTHFNVKPPEYWADLFARNGFFRDVEYDASFILPYSVRYRKNKEPLNRIIKAFERELWSHKKEVLALRDELNKIKPALQTSSKEKDSLIHKLSEQLQEKETYITTKEKEIKDLIGTLGVQDVEIKRLKPLETIVEEKETYITTKEKEIKDLIGTLGVQDVEIKRLKPLETIVEEKETYITTKEKEIKDLIGTLGVQDVEIKRLHENTTIKDSEIKRLHENTTIKDSEIKRLHENTTIKDSEIKRLNEIMREYSACLTAQNKNVDYINTELIAIKNSKMFKLMRAIASSIDALLKKKSDKKGNQLLRIIQVSCKIIKNHGFRFYLSQVKIKLKRKEFHISEIVPLIIRDIPKKSFDEIDMKNIQENIAKFSYAPKISIIMPVYNVDLKWLSKAINSVQSQFYPNWELCICDDYSTDKRIWPFLSEVIKNNKKIKIIRNTLNGGISKASNAALGIADGEFIGLLDNDDELTPDALYEVVRALNHDKSIDMIYSDEDKIDESGHTFNTFAKPDWSPDLLFSVMYTGHFSVYRRALVNRIGGFRSEYDFSQDYDLALRITEKTSKIHHISQTLYHWRTLPTSGARGGKPFARATAIAAVESSIKSRGYKANVVEYSFSNRLKYFLKTHPLVSIVVATDNKENIIHCIDDIFGKTDYDNYEIVIVTNSKLGDFITNHYHKNSKISIVNFDKQYNYSEKANNGAKSATGEYLLFLNDDIEILHGDWIEALLEIFQREEVGAVAGKLLYENNTIQHAGMITNVRNFVETAFHQQEKNSPIYFNFVNSIRNASVLSGACMMVPKKVFDLTSGYDPVNTGIMHSDIDFCFKIRDLGKLLVYTPFCEVRHYGHGTISKSPDRKKFEEMSQSNLYLLKRWSYYLSHDPYFTKEMRSLLLYGYQNSTFEIIPGKRNENHADKKNILLITHDMTQSGAPMVVYGIAKYLVKKGCFVTVATAQEGPLIEKFKQEGIPIIIDSTLLDNPPNEIRRLVTSFDIIIASTILSWRHVFICKEEKRPILWIIQESDFGIHMLGKHPEIGQALRLADKVVFSNTLTAKRYERYDNNNYVIIAGGTEGISDSARVTKSDQKLTVIHAGGFETRKGQDVLLKAISTIPSEYLKNFEFFLIGRVVESDYYSQIKETAKSFPNVHLLNEMTLEKLYDYYKQAQIFICSSRDESLPLTLLDAMSNKMGIITTNVGGISEFLEDGKNCLMVKSEDHESMSKSLLRLLKDKKLFDKISKNAYDTFHKELSQEKYGEKIYDLILTSLQNIPLQKSE